MRLKLAALIFVIFISVVGYRIWTVATQEPEWPTKGLDSNKLWELVQAWRQSEGLDSYLKDDTLCDLAGIRAKEIGKNYSHEGFLEKTGNYPYVLSENIAYGQDTEEAVLDSWLKSPSHAAALRYPWGYSCIAIDGRSSVQIFSNFNDEQP